MYNRRSTTNPCANWHLSLKWGFKEVLRHFLRGARHFQGGGETVFHNLLFKFFGQFTKQFGNS